MFKLVSPRVRGGFTLIELLVAMAIFAIMIAFLAQLMSNTSVATNASKGRLNADDQARFALDRIGDDLSHLSKRADLDYYIKKQSGNDLFYFYSEVPGLGSGGTAIDADNVSGVSLVGYRINAENQLERYSETQSWEDLSFLTYTDNDTVDPHSEINVPAETETDPNFHVLCNGVFRLEITFLLRDGTYSAFPSLQNDSPMLTGIDKVGRRQWDSGETSGATSLCVGLDGTAQIWRGLGWRDVSAVIVTIAVIDDSSLKIISSTSSSLTDVASKFSDTTGTLISPTDLPLKDWSDQIKPGSLGIPKKAVAGIRVYQRAFYLNTL